MINIIFDYHTQTTTETPYTQEHIAKDNADQAKAEEEYRLFRYIDCRRSEFPPITNYLDAIVKNDQVEIDKYIADCLAVKRKYPKPTVEIK